MNTNTSPIKPQVMITSDILIYMISEIEVKPLSQSDVEKSRLQKYAPAI